MPPTKIGPVSQYSFFHVFHTQQNSIFNLSNCFIILSSLDDLIYESKEMPVMLIKPIGGILVKPLVDPIPYSELLYSAKQLFVEYFNKDG